VPPYEHGVSPIGDVERRIGEHVADLVPDGATLQLGIGAIPAATALALRDKRDLGIHTEMFTDPVADLVEAGVVTGARKERNRGKIVTAFDLTGQVCADSIGHHLYSGVGGQMDFIRGAAQAEEGKAIIALPSTAASGTRSRIVATLAAGAGVVTTRAHVRTVVTEWGVAELFGKSTRERAEALIAIAHPDHREELRAEARSTHEL
jgi:4-hydroxybutyrate CoA-transferase